MGYRRIMIFLLLTSLHSSFFLSGCETTNTSIKHNPITFKGNRPDLQVIDTHTHLSPDQTGDFYNGARTALITKYADRFLIGSDLKYGQKRLARTEVITILKHLPPNIVKKIAQENALRIFNLDKQ